MRCSLACTALVATFAIGSCQLQFLHRRGGDQVVSGSFFSSTSWTRGQDGQMHKQTKTSSTEFNQDGSEMKKKLVCRDGECKEVIEIIESSTLQEPPSMRPFVGHPNQPCNGHMHMPARLRGIVDRLFGRMQQQQQHQQQVEIVIEPLRKGPELTHDPFRPLFLDNPRTRWIPLGQYQQRQQQQQLQQQAVQDASAAQDMRLIQIGVALFALTAAYAVVLSVLKCWRVDQVSARERPLRDLSEPLAPAPVNVAIPAAATVTTCKIDPVQTYVSDLYVRANTKNEARAVTQYLARLYMRILA